MKNKPLYYPACVARYASPEELAEIVAGNAEHLDHEAADLLESVADCHRARWQDKQHAVYARRVMRQVSDWLRA